MYAELFGYFLIAFITGFAPMYLMGLFHRAVSISTLD